mgnify:CR=1 FL=1
MIKSSDQFNSGFTSDLREIDAGHDADSFRLWGLDAEKLHDAYWRSRGVQCVRRATPFFKQSGADMYMLMDTGQFVMFDLNSIAESMVWNRAPVTRVRVKTPAVDYVERVVSEGDELIRISRDYTSRYIGSHGVKLTRRASIAEAWSRNEIRYRALRELRRYVDWARTDFYEVKGHVDYTGQSNEMDENLINRLMSVWNRPDQSIAGIRELKPGIWGVDQSQLGSDRIVMVPPIWIGNAICSRSKDLMIGPMAVKDQRRCSIESNVRVYAISEVLTPQSDSGESADDAEINGYQMMKRLIDVMVSLVILLVLVPLLIPISLTVALTSGLPIFFGHERQTKGGRNFKCWKLRTMMRNAESMVLDLQSDNMADGPQVFIRNDPRITRFGRFLRRYHIDELPQFWNVLRGEMSLVGPRPSPENENQFCPAWREARLSIRPGITGLWQVERTRKPGLDFQEWIKYDIEYVNKANLLLDLKIIAKTVIKVVRK